MSAIPPSFGNNLEGLSDRHNAGKNTDVVRSPDSLKVVDPVNLMRRLQRTFELETRSIDQRSPSEREAALAERFFGGR